MKSIGVGRDVGINFRKCRLRKWGGGGGGNRRQHIGSKMNWRIRKGVCSPCLTQWRADLNCALCDRRCPRRPCRAEARCTRVQGWEWSTRPLILPSLDCRHCPWTAGPSPPSKGWTMTTSMTSPGTKTLTAASWVNLSLPCALLLLSSRHCSSVQDGSDALGKAHMRSTPSLCFFRVTAVNSFFRVIAVIGYLWLLGWLGFVPPVELCCTHDLLLIYIYIDIDIDIFRYR